MKQDARPYRSPSFRLAFVASFVAVFGASAYADVLGRLHFVVKNAADEKPLAKATITLRDSAGVRAPLVLTTDEKGTATSSPIEARAWSVETKGEAFDTDRRTVNVVADVTTDVEELLEPLKEKVINISGIRDATKPTDTAADVKRDDAFDKRFPNTVANKQNLSQLLRSTPGIALDSNGQAHPAGEHSSTTVYINGFQLPGAFQGRFGQILSPTSIQSVDVLTGGYAPEYGRETAAILNATLKAGSISPFLDYSLTGGTFGTFEAGLTAGGQFGSEYGVPDEDGKRAKRLGYLLDLNALTTRNAIESPQPNHQEENNGAASYVTFGNFDYRLSAKDSLNLILSANPSQNGVANRTGLDTSRYPLTNLGFGGAGDAGQPSQAALGQDDYQRDRNEFGVLSYRRDIDTRTQALLSFGLIHSGLSVLNGNSAIPTPLPTDSSIEFDPHIVRNGHDVQGQGSLSHLFAGGHNVKAGFVLDKQSGEESYRLTPASLAAENFLEDPDNALTSLANGQTVHVSRDGHYDAGYLQDTWRVTSKFTANYGVRYDDYRQRQTTTLADGTSSVATPGRSEFSPRVNLAYAIRSGTVARASYDHLLIIPPTAQGATVGAAVSPERLNQYDVSIEQQTGPGQSVRLGAFLKEIHNQLDTGLLVPGTQIGAFVTDNIPKDTIRAYTLAYNLVPTKPYGFAGYLSYQLGVAKVQDVADTYNDHDQLHTLSTGFNYTLRTGESLGIVYNYGSGFASSVYDDPGEKRHAHEETNLRLSSNPNLFHRGIGATLEVENLFNEEDLINFNSAFSGTRFQQGRRVLFTINGKF